MTNTLRPCETTGTCYFLESLVETARDGWKEKCATTTDRVMETTPKMNIEDSECVFAAIRSWTEVQMTHELKEAPNA